MCLDRVIFDTDTFLIPSFTLPILAFNSGSSSSCMALCVNRVVMILVSNLPVADAYLTSDAGS